MDDNDNNHDDGHNPGKHPGQTPFAEEVTLKNGTILVFEGVEHAGRDSAHDVVQIREVEQMGSEHNLISHPITLTGQAAQHFLMAGTMVAPDSDDHT